MGRLYAAIGAESLQGMQNFAIVLAQSPSVLLSAQVPTAAVVVDTARLEVAHLGFSHRQSRILAGKTK